ncbi:glycosyltransferase family 4 protein [Hymenobacter aerilatus]|uniref:Glycosyltransferase family 4 protein n=1 Tax=Hymenobacter aerilatus TaxID=2932251 RepID=A0A8T9SRL3_9BACT|nr:glycosyltransferase family 4 protein [Hymenobacter aerilatus]UOR03664.1 glycosyltransferase family 4 protein [Hymenobacter aerilatus]
MKVLLSAYACNPTKGGESGIGYSWTQEWLQHGHEVWCFTRPDERADIEAYLAEHVSPEGRAKLHFVYVAVPGWVDYLYRWQFGVYLHYMVWQYQAWRAARKLEATVGFDLIHHATYGSLQMASWLWRVGKPLIIGPLGGGQQTPRSFQSYIPDWFKSETMRNTISRVLMAGDRNVRHSIRHAALVLTTNQETAAKVRALGARRVELFLDSGLPESFLPAEFPVREPADQLRLLWLGRLIHRKALPLVLDALTKVAARVPFHLTIVGDGPVGAELPELLRQRGLTDRVTWRGSLPWAEVREVFLTHDAFLFASLRDSFASQFLEAMGAGLPIITLNHQGARDFIPAEAAIKVPVTTPDETVAALARAVEECYDHPERRLAMGRAGYAFARTQSWPARSQRMLHLIEEAVPHATVLQKA